MVQKQYQILFLSIILTNVLAKIENNGLNSYNKHLSVNQQNKLQQKPELFFEEQQQTKQEIPFGGSDIILQNNNFHQDLEIQQSQQQQQQQETYSYSDFSSGSWNTDNCQQNLLGSPVNFNVDVEPVCDPDNIVLFHPNYDSIDSKLENSGNSLFARGNWGELEATIEGQTIKYISKKFEFHSPSEHVVNGVSYDLEMQIQFGITKESQKEIQELQFQQQQNPNLQQQIQTPDEIAILSFLFVESENGSYNMEDFFQTFNPEKACFKKDCKNKEMDISQEFADFQQIFEVESYYYYQGSLTAPPCTTPVSWFVSTEILNINENWLGQFKKLWQKNPSFSKNKEKFGDQKSQWVGNNRPVQRDIDPEIYQNCI